MAEYKWVAQYNDGTILEQSEEVGYLDIDRSKLAVFALVDETTPVLQVIFDEDGDKLVWTRRVFWNENNTKVFHIVGKKGQFILAVDDNGSIIARHNFVDDGLFDEVVDGLRI